MAGENHFFYDGGGHTCPTSSVHRTSFPFSLVLSLALFLAPPLHPPLHPPTPRYRQSAYDQVGRCELGCLLQLHVFTIDFSARLFHPLVFIYLLFTRSTLKVRCVQRHHAQQPRNQSRCRQRNHPPHEDEPELRPVDRLDVVVHQRRANQRSSQALRRRHRKAQTRRKQNRHRGSQLRGESSSRAHLGDLVAHGAHNVVSVEPEPKTKQQTSHNQHPDGRSRLCGNLTLLVRLEHSRPWSHGVRNVVATVGNRHHDSRDDLAVCPQVFNAHVVTVCTCVDGSELVAVVADNIASHT
jgi:hypothetical protein